MSENLRHRMSRSCLSPGAKAITRHSTRLMPEVQKELHRIAARYMAAERPGHDLQATALINEAYLRLVDWKDIQWADRAHFFGMAANMMRRVLVDHARSRDRVKRGGEAIQVSFVEAAHVPALNARTCWRWTKSCSGSRKSIRERARSSRCVSSAA